MDQQRLQRVARARVLALALLHDPDRLVQMSSRVDVAVANSISMAEHGNSRVLLHELHQVLAAAGDDEVDVPTEIFGKKC